MIFTLIKHHHYHHQQQQHHCHFLVHYVGKPSVVTILFKIEIFSNLSSFALYATTHITAFQISFTTVLCFNFFDTQMIQKSASDASAMLNKMSFVILPVFNPDGYEYTWTVRMISIIIYLLKSLFSSSLFCNFEAHLNVITEKGIRGHLLILDGRTCGQIK